MMLRVLFVDDDPVYWELVQTIFNQEPLLQAVAIDRLTDGTDALAYLTRSEPFADPAQYPWPDVVFLDQRMSRMDGTQTLEALREEGAAGTVSICLMTSSEQSRLIEQALAAGARFCFTKPTTLEQLREQFVRIIAFFLNVVRLPSNPTRGRSR